MAIGEALGGFAILGVVLWLRNRLFYPADGQYREARKEFTRLLKSSSAAKGLESKYIKSQVAKLKDRYPYIDPVDETPTALQLPRDDEVPPLSLAGSFELVKVGRARKRIKWWLLRREGGACHLKAGDVTRLLMHSPNFNGPVNRLPWPLSVIQPHDIDYVERAGDGPDTCYKFPRHQIDVAIEHFLRDALSEEGVQLMPS